MRPRIAQIPDHYIRSLVGVYGPESREKNDELTDTIIARRDAVAKAYDIAHRMKSVASGLGP